MKTSALALLAVISSVNANLPSLSIKVSDGSFADLGGLEPTLSWSANAKAGDIDIEYGLEADARVSSDLASLPKNVWGKASTDIGGWGVTARAEFQGTDFSSADLDIDAVNDDLSIHIDASSDGSLAVNRVEATKSFDADGAAVTVTPRYDVGSGSTDVVVSYAKDDTSLELTASQEAQSITISKQIDATNRVAPTIGSNGDFSLEWERSLSDDSSLTATVKPNDSVDVEWSDGAWVANVNMPLEGNSISGANVSIKRDVSF